MLALKSFERMRELEQAARGRRARPKAGVRTETRLLDLDEQGQRISERIANEAVAWPADLIVLGTHGRRGMDRLMLGSVAEGVARAATVPVMLVRGT
jgi:nucleotide-binding universal stress UspA family protein